MVRPRGRDLDRGRAGDRQSLVRTASMRDGHRLVELVDERRREPPARAGERDRARGLDLHRAELGLDPGAGPLGGARGRRSDGGGRSTTALPSAWSATAAGACRCGSARFCRVSPDRGQRAGGAEVGRRRARAWPGWRGRRAGTAGPLGRGRRPWRPPTEVRSSQSASRPLEEAGGCRSASSLEGSTTTSGSATGGEHAAPPR